MRMKYILLYLIFFIYNEDDTIIYPRRVLWYLRELAIVAIEQWYCWKIEQWFTFYKMDKMT